jgi:hypothetical protein
VTTIICRTCNKGFPKPARRGRPPVICDSCKGAKPTKAEAPQKAVEPQGVTTTPKKPSQAPSVGLRASKVAPYRSGFCGVTRQNDGSHKSHPASIHKLCGIDICACDCHAKKAS